ncbi:MAG TPA: S8 family serine peptidase [Thermoanaerobaculia bacterium]|nr:S8 family serine peptidase [Thermoanaerobaculia bacterium]
MAGTSKKRPTRATRAARPGAQSKKPSAPKARARTRRSKDSPRLRDEHKVQPKLRLIANSSDVVNTLRAERSASVFVTDPALLARVPCHRQARDRPLAKRPRGFRKGKSLARMPAAVRANVFVQLQDPLQKLSAAVRKASTGRRQDLVAATVSMSQLDTILSEPGVAGVELAERVTFSPPNDVRPVLDQDGPALGHGGVIDAEREAIGPQAGAHGPVLVGIIDVQGFDFAHPDFLDAQGKTRFVAIWDQGGTTRPSPSGFGYGAEIENDHLNAALAAAPAAGIPAWELEPQSQLAVSSHGTHVASIAAGNHGVCPHALLAGVLLELPREDWDRRRSFYDSTRIAHAVDWLLQLGQRLEHDLGQPVPVSINISLGTNGHAHDASSGVCRWIDYAISTPGRSVCVAAGNAGQEAPVEPGDWGFMLGRIHTSGRIAASGLTRDLQWVVVGDGIADLSENELEIWYPPQDRFDVMLRPPGSTTWIGPIGPGQFVENQLLESGTFVSVYNERYAPANGANYIAVYLSPFLSEDGVVGVAAGTWTVRLVGREVRDGSYHAWIERDDPRRLGRVGMQEAWAFPSFFSRLTNVDQSSVSSLACGQRIVSVANLDPAREVINITSSQGPTRDNREKPEICAPGTDVLAANGFDPEATWVRMTGTSMASPYVAGVVAWMLAVEPRLTAAQVGGILRRTARPLPGVDFHWRDDAGYGRIDPTACIAEARRIYEREDLTP